MCFGKSGKLNYTPAGSCNPCATFVLQMSLEHGDERRGRLSPCTRLQCCSVVQTGYSSAYTTCEHATSYWKALTATANTTSTAARANANVPCTACPSA